MLARNVPANSSKFLKHATNSISRRLQREALFGCGLAVDGRLKESGRRAFSASSGPPSGSVPSDSPIRISQLLGTLLVFGIGATSWGLYEFYTTLTMWPKEVREELRAGLKAKQRGDMKLARRHLTKAWATTQTISPDALSPDPYLKLSGVAIVLAEVLEAEEDFEQAFSVLSTALTTFIGNPNSSSPPLSISQNGAKAPELNSTDSASASSWSAPSPPRPSLYTLLDSSRATAIKSQINSKARMRAVALALKLGELAEMLKRPEEEEHWLEFAVEEVLRLIQDEHGLVHDMRQGFVKAPSHSGSDSVRSREEKGDEKRADREHEHETTVRDILNPDSQDEGLGLPAWVSLTKTELAAPMERLASFYTRQGKYGNAILLYRVASTLLVRPKSQLNPSPSVPELCQALQIENVHMALMMDLHRSNPDDPSLRRDIPHALTRSINIYDEAVRRHGRAKVQDDGIAGETEITLCDEVYPAVMYNAGVYYEEQGSLEQALRSYSLSYRALRVRGSREMMYEALESARRIQRIIHKNAQQASPQDIASTRNSTQSSDSLDNSARQ